MKTATKNVTLELIDNRLDRLEDIIESGFQAIGQQFQVIDKRFDEVDKRFDGIDFKLIEIDRRLEEHDQQLKDLKEGQNKLFSILDAIAKQQEIDNDERLMLQHQLDKMILWAKQVAAKVGVELTAL
jgi:chromosome segregation ATPase